MAKQTFSVGQVLSAAQMTSLQATAMGGGAPVTKTASYTLVAADAGTVIQMNSASSTTITVNTALFAAGDSIQIQNIGAGVCTITAGTATVTTAGSLALSQWEGGTLYFTSTSASIFFDVVQSGFTSPLTTKGDLYTRTSSADARLPVGTNGYTLVADSAEATGLKWAAPAGGGKVLQVVSATTATSTSIITTTYTDTTITATITPTSASSKILVLASSIAYLFRETANEFGASARLMRGATALFTNGNFMIIGGVSVSQKSLCVQSAWNYLDSPATTSATTYKIQAKSDGTGEIRFQAGSDTSVITLLEIGA